MENQMQRPPAARENAVLYRPVDRDHVDQHNVYCTLYKPSATDKTMI